MQKETVDLSDSQDGVIGDSLWLHPGCPYEINISLRHWDQQAVVTLLYEGDSYEPDRRWHFPWDSLPVRLPLRLTKEDHPNKVIRTEVEREIQAFYAQLLGRFRRPVRHHELHTDASSELEFSL